MVGPVYHYDCGVKFVGIQPVSRGSGLLYNKSINALHLLLLANFGTFCMSLLTQPGMKERLHGKIISTDLPLRTYCIVQLRQHWLYMKECMHLTEEQRSFFVMRAMKRFHEVAIVEYFCFSFFNIPCIFIVDICTKPRYILTN